MPNPRFPKVGTDDLRKVAQAAATLVKEHFGINVESTTANEKELGLLFPGVGLGTGGQIRKMKDVPALRWINDPINLRRQPLQKRGRSSIPVAPTRVLNSGAADNLHRKPEIPKSWNR